MYPRKKKNVPQRCSSIAFDFFDLSSSNLVQESSVDLWDNLNKVRGLPHNALHFPSLNVFISLVPWFSFLPHLDLAKLLSWSEPSPILLLSVSTSQLYVFTIALLLANYCHRESIIGASLKRAPQLRVDLAFCHDIRVYIYRPADRCLWSGARRQGRMLRAKYSRRKFVWDLSSVLVDVPSHSSSNSSLIELVRV